MSYDLFFTTRVGSPPLSEAAFQRHFGSRRNFRIEQRQAWYTNEDTGVYFTFELPSLVPEPDPEATPYEVSFNLNYFRPNYFALEAEIEVSAFVAAFNPSLEDPQMHGMGSGPYSSEGFLAGWQAGNRFACSAARQSNVSARTLPGATLQAMWRWNFSRHTRQTSLGEAVFVPKINIFTSTAGGAAATFVVWPDAIPVHIPPVDYVLVSRDELAPRSFFRGRRPDHLLIPWSAAQPAINAAATRVSESVLELTYRDRPRPLLEWVRGLPPQPLEITALSSDKVLDHELFEENPGA